jgi:hypothetical protein
MAAQLQDGAQFFFHSRYLAVKARRVHTAFHYPAAEVNRIPSGRDRYWRPAYLVTQRPPLSIQNKTNAELAQKFSEWLVAQRYSRGTHQARAALALSPFVVIVSTFTPSTFLVSETA